MKQGKPGDTIDRQQMGEIIGRQIPSMTSPGAGNVRTAIRRLADAGGPYWLWDTHIQAWRCVTEGDFLDETRREQKCLTRRQRRKLRQLVAMDRSKMDSTRRLDHQLLQIQFAMASESLSTGFGKRLVATGTVDKLKQPDQGRLIELMKNGT